MKYICVEKGTLLSNAEEDPPWENPQPPRPLTFLTGETEGEVRDKLNAYLVSPEGVREYGAKHVFLPADKRTSEAHVWRRNDRNWRFVFEIVPFNEELLKKPELKLPPRAYEECV